MSRKGKAPIPLPKAVEVKWDKQQISVKGPKGALTQTVKKGVKVDVQEQQIVVSLESSLAEQTNFHGLYRTLIANMVKGVSEGFKKVLEMVGVGYRAAVKGNRLDVEVGYSHPTELPIPQGITVTVEKNSTIIVEGADIQSVGEFAAHIRSMRPPEPYKGKGIRYQNEHIRRKAGKAAAKK